jgi:methylmalonyl-CoA mutase
MPVIPLADSFEPAARTDWLALVEKTLKGASLDSLTRRTADGLAIEPLYPAPWAGSTANPARAPAVDRPWDIRAPIRQPEPSAAHDALLTALEGGAASVLLGIDPGGDSGVAIDSSEALARLLDGVLTDIAPIALDAGFLGPQAAYWLSAATKASPAAPLAFHLDPLGAFAAAGASPGPIESHLIAAANTAARLSTTHPKASLFLASGAVVHEAGGTAAEELAFALAAALGYAKALVRAGLSMEAALGGIVLGLITDVDPLVSIAKLRAARILWTRFTQVCGAPRPAAIEARSSGRMLTRADPWTNLVRLTAAGFAAAVGGADAIVLGAFTDVLGAPTPFAERLARNTQLILMEEGHVGAAIDPAGGAGAFEALTIDLARAAWERFTGIEAAGGVIAALREGLIARETDIAREAFAAGLADKTIRIVGVTEFVNPESRPAEVDTTVGAPVPGPDPRLPGPDSRCPALTPITLESLVP